MYLAIQSQPPGSVQGTLRITEQVLVPGLLPTCLVGFAVRQRCCWWIALQTSSSDVCLAGFAFRQDCCWWIALPTRSPDICLAGSAFRQHCSW